MPKPRKVYVSVKEASVVNNRLVFVHDGRKYTTSPIVDVRGDAFGYACVETNNTLYVFGGLSQQSLKQILAGRGHNHAKYNVLP